VSVPTIPKLEGGGLLLSQTYKRPHRSGAGPQANEGRCTSVVFMGKEASARRALDSRSSSEAVAPELERGRAGLRLNAVDERAQSRGRVRLAAVAAALPEPAATELGN
jgi:hypothetical protein